MDNSYDAINHMMELGMGVGLAQQMIRTMNECMQQTTIPTVSLQAPAMPQAKVIEYYVVVDENVAGPFNEQQLTSLAQNKQLVADTYVWAKGMDNWAMAKQIPEVNKILILNSLL